MTPAPPPTASTSHQASEELTYEALMNTWRKELRAATLTKVDHAFYQRLDEHLRALQEEYQREHAVNPNSPRVMILQDELRNLQRARDDLFDIREKKIAVAALIAARGGNPDRNAMTKGELEVFEELVRVFKEGRRLLIKRGERSAADVAPQARGGPPVAPEPVGSSFVGEAPAQPASVAPTPPPPLEAALPGLATATPLAAPPPAPVTIVAVSAGPVAPPSPLRSGRVLVRVLQPVEPFTASDLRTYRLEPRDVVSLPPGVAKALVAHGKAELLAQEG